MRSFVRYFGAFFALGRKKFAINKGDRGLLCPDLSLAIRAVLGALGVFGLCGRLLFVAVAVRGLLFGGLLA